MRKQDREFIKNKYNGRCAYCGVELPKRWHVDHFKPVKRRWELYTCKKTGTQKSRTLEMSAPENDILENMMPSCIKCNNDKSDMDIESWRKLIGMRIKTLNQSPKYSSYQKAKRFGLIKETGRKVVFYFEKQR